MAISNEEMTVNMLREALAGIDGADDLPVRVHAEYGPMGIYSIRKHVVTGEDNEVTDAFVVING